MKQLIAIVAVFALASSNLWAEGEQKLPEYVLPVLQNWLTYNTEVVEACVFREQWIAPTEKIPKGMLLKFGTITRVHKGSVKVGHRIVLPYLFEISVGTWEQEARLRPDRISMVDGELMISMFNKKDSPEENGYRNVGDDISRFPFGSEFHKAFLIEQDRDPKLEGIQN
jgi:hypothetical protein